MESLLLAVAGDTIGVIGAAASSRVDRPWARNADVREVDGRRDGLAGGAQGPTADRPAS